MAVERQIGIPKVDILFVDLIRDFFKIKDQGRIILWAIFSNQRFELTFGRDKYGFHIGSSEQSVKDFLGSMVRSKRAGEKMWKIFLNETSSLEDDFFSKPVGQFPETTLVLPVAQVNTILMNLLRQGVYFEFNNNQ